MIHIEIGQLDCSPWRNDVEYLPGQKVVVTANGVQKKYVSIKRSLNVFPPDSCASEDGSHCWEQM